MTPAPPIPDNITAALNMMPDATRLVLVCLREVIFEVAGTIPSSGQVTETLKWGQPSYAVPTGTPIRLGVTKAGVPALFVHCQTRVVSEARTHLAADLQFEDNRAVLVPHDTDLAKVAVRQVVHAALTYRLRR